MADKPAPTSPAKKPNIFVRLWQKSGLNLFMILLGMKGALPATIALAAYQGTAFAEIYSTLGYLVAIIGTLSLSIQPRAKYLQSMITSIFAICLGAAVTLLQIRCVVSARSAPPGGTQTGSSGSQEAQRYDASANATSAVFLVFWVYLANIVKSMRPQLMLAIIQFCIFVVVGSVYAPSFPVMSAGLSFVRRLLITMLTGHAVACAVSLFILPVTSRAMVTKQMGGFTKLLKACLAAHGNYMHTVHDTIDKGDSSTEEKQAATQLKGLLANTNELLGKIKLELNFARQEMAFGKLGPEHYTRIFQELRYVYQPILGMSTFLGIVTSLREHKATDSNDPDVQEGMKALKKLEADEWEEVIALSREPYTHYQQALFGGLQHVAYRLEFEKRPKAKAGPDIERNATSTPQPGDADFTKHLEDSLYTFHQHRIAVIQEWARTKNMSLPKHYWRNAIEQPQLHRLGTTLIREKINQHQLYMILYMNFLHMAVGRALLRLARYADELVADGTMKNRRFIFPGGQRLREFFMSALTQSDSDETMSPDSNGGSNIYLGDAFNTRKDPEHLPPTNIYERTTNIIRRLPAAMRSRHAQFGARAALATISIGVIGFLRQTRPFFLEQRGLWALIMVAFSMDPYAGQGVFGLVARIGGTIFAMVSSIVLVYMCDHKAAAIIAVFWVYMSCCNIFMIKHMELSVVAIISSVTVILVVGYELQVNKIGLSAATSNGQKFYSISLLAIYRLTTVCAGLFSAFVWTYFPYPITTHGAIRHDVGSALYILANYYSCVHTTLEARLHLGPAINSLPATHPVRKLDIARMKVFGKVLLMLNRLHTHSRFTRFEPPFGGKFPSKTYAELIASIENIFSYISLMEYSSKAFIRSSVELRLSRAPTQISTSSGASASTAVTPTISRQVSNAAPLNNVEEKINEGETPTSETTLSPPRTAPSTLSTTGLQPQQGSTTVLPAPIDTAAEEAWLASFRHFAASTYQRVTSHALTSTLCLLSAAIRHGQPLPPYLKAPPALAAPSQQPFMTREEYKEDEKEEKELDREEERLLDIEHLAHPAFAAFAVGEVTSAFITAELGSVLRNVRSLVGEVDFSFHVVGTEDEEGGEGSKWWEMVDKEKRA